LAKNRSVVSLGSLLICVLTTGLYCQTAGNSHQECLEGLPSSWGSNFGPEWHKNEAAYWACRLGVDSKTVETWKKAANLRGMFQDLLPVTIGNQRVVIVEEVQGTAGCHDFKALTQANGVWQQVWELPRGETDPPMRYCTLSCPAIRLKVDRRDLILEIPGTSDPQEDMTFSCKHIDWHQERYRWNGKSFKPATHHGIQTLNRPSCLESKRPN
jgi:hypothetical protein